MVQWKDLRSEMFANFPWPGREGSDKSMPLPPSFLKVPDSESRFGGNDERQRAGHLFIAFSKDISGQKPAAGGRAGPPDRRRAVSLAAESARKGRHDGSRRPWKYFPHISGVRRINTGKTVYKDKSNE